MEHLAFEVGGERPMTIFVVLQSNVPVYIQQCHREHSDVSAHVPVSGKRARLCARELWF
jgi:hypothetical protein